MQSEALKLNEWLRQREVDELLRYVRHRTALAHASRRDHTRRLIIEMGLFAGLRAFEIGGLNLKHLPLANGTLAIGVVKGKRSKDRTVPVSRELAQLIWHYVVDIRKLIKPIPEEIEPVIWPYLAGDENTLAAISDRQRRQINDYLHGVRTAGTGIVDAPLLVSELGNRLGRHTIWSSVSLTGVALGYERPVGKRERNSDRNALYPHRLRHTCAMRMALANKPMSEIQAYLGHANITMTARYTITAQTQMSKTAQEMHC